MKSGCLTEHDKLSNCSKDDLLEVIKGLKQENDDLRAAVKRHEDYDICVCKKTDDPTTNNQLESVSYAVNHVNENIFALDTDGNFIFTNKQFLRDHDKDVSLGNDRVYDVLFTIKSKDEWEEVKKSIKINGGVLKYISDVKKDDGSNISYEIVAHLATENNNDTYWIFARDVTVRREQDKKIRELNSLMEAILNNIPVYLFVKDTADDFRYLYWNKAFEVHSGIPASKAVGNTDFDIFPDINDAQKFRRDDLELISHGERVEYIEDYRGVHQEDRVVKTVKRLVTRENEAPLLIGVCWDITDIKRTEQELIEAKHEAEQSNRLKSAFLANMSHEIRTPLNAIVGFSKLISSTEDPEEKQQFSNIIDSNADLLLQLINDILDLSKIEAGTLDFVKAEMNLNELCYTMLEVHRMKAKPGVSLIFEENNLNLIIKSDRNRLAQAFTNLLTNALKFTESGEIRFGFSIKGDKIEVFVRDTGIGIEKDKLSSVFERFVKLNTFVQGTGLGLSITRMIVEKIGGEISVNSIEGKGTEFIFTIPYKTTTSF